jgi:predicted aspartyl protease
MGRVAVPAKIENVNDLYEVADGRRAGEAVRSVEVDDALADTGAMYLGLPGALIVRLGLRPFRTRKSITAGGPVELRIFSTVRLTVQGRDCNCDVMELPDDCPIVIGQLPLEMLDFCIDPVGRRLIGNPAHGGEFLIEAL